MDKPVTVQVNGADAVTACPLNYCYQVQNSPDVKLANVAKALYYYWGLTSLLIMADPYEVTDHSGDTLKDIIYTEHPDTHVKLQGYTIPYVKEAVEMVLKAATIAPQIRYVGWDVVTTPTGPAIIEGNTYCAHDFWQLPPHTPDGIGMLLKIKEYIPEFFEGKIK